jgi:NADPH:quinone reductase-like Zn-dependent oxidoreductase
VTSEHAGTVEFTRTMRAIRLHAPGGVGGLALEVCPPPPVRSGEALVRVRAAAITRDELEWPVDRLPAIPSYELSGVVAAVGAGVDSVSVGDDVFALTPFDRDGAAADYVAAPAALLAPRPTTLDDVESAAVPLAALSAWQGLFDRGGLRENDRILIHGASGGVGHFATQLARWRGAYVIATASGEGMETARRLGADEVFDRAGNLRGALEPVDLVFDTAGGDSLARSTALVRDGGRIVSVAEEPPPGDGRIETTYFVVEPDGLVLSQVSALLDAGTLHPLIDSIYPLEKAREAFERSLQPGKRGKVVLRVAE